MRSMTRYADPTACPDCHADISSGPDRCPTCDLSLRHPVGAELFATLQHADVLLDRLRREPVPQTPLTAPPVKTGSVKTGPANTAPYPVPAPGPQSQPPADRQSKASGRSLRGSSVPGILLGLGALCLLVAAAVFLAVAWSFLGIGGRTAALVALTVAAGGGGVVLARRGLQVAGESLTTVALGFLVLDLFGADDAGWLGSASDSLFIPILGSSMAVAGLVLALAARRDRTGQSNSLVASQLISGLGVLIAYVGLRDWLSSDLWVSGVGVGLVAALVWSVVLFAPPLTFLRWSLVALCGIVWLGLLTAGLGALPDPVTFTGLWTGSGWALLVAAGYLAALALIPASRTAAQWWLGAAAILVTGTLALPAIETSYDGWMLTALGATAAWTFLAWLLPHPWTWSARLPAVASALPVVAGLSVLASEAMARIADPAPAYSASIASRFPARPPAFELPLSPWLLIPAAVVLTGLVLVVAADRLTVTTWRTTVVAVSILAISALLTLSLFAVPIWTVSASLTLAAVGANVVATREDRWDPTSVTSLLGAGVLFAAALTVAPPSAGLLAIVATALTATAAYAAGLARSESVRVSGYVAAPLALAVSLHGLGDVLDVSVSYRAIVVLLLLGAAAIAVPRPELELAAATGGVVMSTLAVTAPDGGSGVLAVLLTLSGALVTISALLNPDRRALGWVGGLLLAAATWVRLAELGVGTPEAYTLPSALALLAVGGLRLRHDPSTSTVKLLGPGLALATLPSLLWVWDEPVSLRALALGLTCLALVLAGAAVRWSAPLTMGALVGGSLVLVEATPYLLQAPQWILIGLAGAVLTLTGVTWESRMRDVQHAGAYLARLR